MRQQQLKPRKETGMNYMPWKLEDGMRSQDQLAKALVLYRSFPDLVLSS